MNKYIIIIVFSLLSQLSIAQNNDCFTARHISNPDDYCSELKQFNNIGVGSSGIVRPSCWPNEANDVWFSFTPLNLAFVVKLFAEGSYGNLQNPSMVIYTGHCTALSEVACSSVLSGSNEIEIAMTDIVIGQLYFIRIDARDGQSGDFTLCIKTFTPVPDPESDCKDGVILCNKDPFVVENLLGTGDDTNEIEPGNCIEQEFASVWYKWTCDQSGSLDFDLIPNNPQDDLDFVLYRLPNGINDCTGKIVTRCMASGESVGAGQIVNSPCFGATGLRPSSNDTREEPGCSGNSDNYLASLNMISGESYVLIVNNFSNSGFGFGMNFGGSGTFLGPESDFDAFALDDYECDKTIQFINQSLSNTDEIISYSWQFGSGAIPGSSNLEGPHDVIYDSFGDKIIALTIESSRGCIVTKLLPISVAACCQDTSTLGLDAIGNDLNCFYDINGSVQGIGINGAPPYNYSLDALDYQANPFFYDLGVGTYNVYVQDRKGCEASTVATISSPPELIVDAGPDQTVDLGEEVQINASYSPPIDIIDIVWTPTIGFQSCIDCLDPTTIAPGTTTYVIEIINENGCIDLDTITIFTNSIRKVIAPNIITPGSNDGNDKFSLSLGAAADYIELLEIYDRWGNQVYRGENLFKDTPYGWDGYFKNQPVNPGVFAWVADVHFIDGVTLNYTGDLTIIR